MNDARLGERWSAGTPWPRTVEGPAHCVDVGKRRRRSKADTRSGLGHHKQCTGLEMEMLRPSAWPAALVRLRWEGGEFIPWPFVFELNILIWRSQPLAHIPAAHTTVRLVYTTRPRILDLPGNVLSPDFGHPLPPALPSKGYQYVDTLTVRYYQNASPCHFSSLRHVRVILCYNLVASSDKLSRRQRVVVAYETLLLFGEFIISTTTTNDFCILALKHRKKAVCKQC